MQESEESGECLHALGSDLGLLSDQLTKLVNAEFITGINLEVDVNKNNGFAVLSLKTLVRRDDWKNLGFETLLSKYKLTKIEKEEICKT